MPDPIQLYLLATYNMSREIVSSQSVIPPSRLLSLPAYWLEIQCSDAGSSKKPVHGELLSEKDERKVDMSEKKGDVKIETGEKDGKRGQWSDRSEDPLMQKDERHG
jgi:hypothetical protein